MSFVDTPPIKDGIVSSVKGGFGLLITGLVFAHFSKTQEVENSQKLKTQTNFMENSRQIFPKLRFPATASKSSLV